eukprot:scaffold10838_cov99-Isochrysis_galbana.AAC.5
MGVTARPGECPRPSRTARRLGRQRVSARARGLRRPCVFAAARNRASGRGGLLCGQSRRLRGCVPGCQGERDRRVRLRASLALLVVGSGRGFTTIPRPGASTTPLRQALPIPSPGAVITLGCYVPPNPHPSMAPSPAIAPVGNARCAQAFGASPRSRDRIPPSRAACCCVGSWPESNSTPARAGPAVPPCGICPSQPGVSPCRVQCGADTGATAVPPSGIDPSRGADTAAPGGGGDPSVGGDGHQSATCAAA